MTGDDGDNRVDLTAEQAIAMLPDGDCVHVFLNPGAVLIGADWSRDGVEALIREGECTLAGEQATTLGHGLAVFKGQWHFVQTRKR